MQIEMKPLSTGQGSRQSLIIHAVLIKVRDGMAVEVCLPG